MHFLWEESEHLIMSVVLYVVNLSIVVHVNDIDCVNLSKLVHANNACFVYLSKLVHANDAFLLF